MPMSRSFLAPFTLLLVLCLVGCGSSGGDFVFAPSSEGPGSTATVELRSVLAQTVVPTEVESLRAKGFDSQQVLRYGPVTQDKAAVVQWTQVPVEVTDFVIEYLDAEEQILGLAQVAVQLFPNETLVVENPTILGVSASLQQLSVTPASRSIALGTSTQFAALGTFSDGTSADLTLVASWSSSDPQVASVSQGTAQGLAEGDSTLTAGFAGLSAQANLQITDAVATSVRVESGAKDGSTLVGLEQTLNLKALATFSDGSEQEVTDNAVWSSEHPNLATVNAGVVTGHSPGQAFIEAAFGGQSGKLQVTVQMVPLPDLVLSGATFTFDTDSGVLTPQIGNNPTPPGWNGDEGRLVLRSFTLENGATLNLTGSEPFKVKAESSITISGVMAFDGAPGEDGEDSTTGGTGDNGTNGNPGGDINLFSSGDLTVTGTISATGGHGGHGGAYNVSGHNFDTVTGGAGGRGGDSGEIILTAGDNLTVDQDALTRNGGDGGNGGGVTIQGINSDTATATGGAGGNGGNGTSGGDGGNGGNVTIEVINFGPATGGAGGNGGDGTSGGAGGDGGNGGDVTVNGTNGETATTGGAGGDGGNGTSDGAGGDGGSGGDVHIGNHNGGSATGGVGGNGGDGTSGGAGGNGGNVTVHADNFDTATATGGAGGNGGALNGTGGNGGNVTIQGNNGGTATGGSGGHGGDGGEGGDGGTQGGDGGRGGNVDIGFDNYFGANATGGAGGNGGDGGTQGGDGGNGGDVDIGELNVGAATGGSGGSGGNGGDGTSGGTGGDGGNGGNVVVGLGTPGTGGTGGNGGNPNGANGSDGSP